MSDRTKIYAHNAELAAEAKKNGTDYKDPIIPRSALSAFSGFEEVGPVVDVDSAAVKKAPTGTKKATAKRPPAKKAAAKTAAAADTTSKEK